MTEQLPSCCEYHAKQLPHGCGQGDKCPARVQHAAIAAYREPIGYESAAPASYLPREQALPIDFVGPEPLLPAWALYVGVAIMVTLAAWAVL